MLFMSMSAFHWIGRLSLLCGLGPGLCSEKSDLWVIQRHLALLDFSLIGSCLVGNTQLALQIIKRNQLLPSLKTLSDMRKKPVFQPVHSIQPIQMPPFTTVQRKWGFNLQLPYPPGLGILYSFLTYDTCIPQLLECVHLCKFLIKHGNKKAGLEVFP